MKNDLWDPACSGYWHLGSVIRALRTSRESTHNIRHQRRIRDLPSREVLRHIIEGVSAALFPTHYGRPDLNDESIDYFVGETLHVALDHLVEQVRRSLRFNRDEQDKDEVELGERARSITQSFASSLPGIRELLVSDVKAALEGDPAAGSVAEIMLCYPGTIAVLYHRLAHCLHRHGAPFLARLVADIAHTLTGIDIHPAAQIGGCFFIDHGTGVVIGETTIIGRNVRLYQAVTLGARRFPKDTAGALIRGVPRHPIVEDNVVIYAGATILGRITIGAGSTIGGNVWLTQSVEPGSSITQPQSRNL